MESLHQLSRHEMPLTDFKKVLNARPSAIVLKSLNTILFSLQLQLYSYP